MPCPVGIDAPRIFELNNEAVMYGDRDIPADLLNWKDTLSIHVNHAGSAPKPAERKFLFQNN